jgi:aminopeptidase N
VYYETFKYSNASINDFKNICERVSGKNLDKFFEQWIFNKGQIQLDYETETKESSEGFLVSIHLQQTQDEYEEFHFPLEVKLLFNDNMEKRFRYDIASRDTVLEILTNEFPDSVELDPDRWLLASFNQKEE